MTLDLQALTAALAEDSRVVLATVFGSARDGNVREGSDVDIAVLLSPQPSPVEFYDFYVSLANRLKTIPELDLIDLGRANSVLAFEALCGRRLVVRDAKAATASASAVARQYEDDMLHARVA